MLQPYANEAQKGKRYVRVYNNSGSAISNGAIKNIVEGWITGKGVVKVPVAPATNATESNVIGIVDNNPTGSIANGEYGNVLVEGQYGSLAEGYGVATSGTVTANDQLEVLNGGTAFIRSGSGNDALAAILNETCAVSVENVTTNVWAVHLIGRQHSIEAS